MRTLRARKITRLLLVIVAVAAVAVFAMEVDVRSAAHPIYETIAQAPVMPVAVVFGAEGPILVDRVQTGAALYKAGKVQKLLMTGDNRRFNYDEPGQMRAMALAEGVPSRDIVCDAAGVRTYDSVYRARAIFGVTRAIFVTQRFHLPRALYLGRSLGLRVVGMDAARRRYVNQGGFELHEFFADLDAWMDVHIHLRPKSLGRPEPIFPL